VIRRLKNLQKERFKKTVDIIHQNTGKSKLYIKFDMFCNFIVRGSGYTDYFRCNFIELTKKEKKTFLTTVKFFKIADYLNDENYEFVLKDKTIFNHVFREFIGRGFIDLRQSNYEDFCSFLEKEEIVFAKKPTGESGYGVSKIIVGEEDTKKLYDKLVSLDQTLIEQAIIQSKEANEINANVVNSFRVVTLLKDGIPHVLCNGIRTNQDKNPVIGATNDLYFTMGEDGKIASNVIDDFANVYEVHPLNGKRFKDIQLNGIKEAFEMCKEASLRIPQVRIIGWDVALTDDGPILIEGNEYTGFGFMQFYKLSGKRTGLLKDISDILGDEMKNIKL